MAFSPSSSIDPGYGTGGAGSRDGYLNGDISGLGSRKRSLQSADIAPWIHPTIQGLCNELEAPAAAPHMLAGVTAILNLPSPPSSNSRGKKDKIPALIAAVYLYVRTRLSGRETSGREYIPQKNEVLNTLAKLKENQARCLRDSSVHQKEKTEVHKEPTSEGLEWEGWERVGSKDVDAWLVEISEARGCGWVKLDWFNDIIEGAGLKDLPKSKQIAPKAVNSKKADEKDTPSADEESDENSDKSADDADSDKSDEYSESASKKRRPSTATSKCATKRKSDAVESPCQRHKKKQKVDNDKEDAVHEQEFYEIENSGKKNLRVIPIAGVKPWDSLLSKESATLSDWKFNIGDTVYVRRTGKPDGLAKVSDIRHLGPKHDLVELVWYYTRDDIKEELPEQLQAHLDEEWPPDAPFSEMLSSNRTVNNWNALSKKASPEVMARVCSDKFYVTTDSLRKICKAGHPRYKWMKELLHLEAKEEADPGSEDCPMLGPDAMSDIQPSPTPPQTPMWCVSPQQIPSPLSEENQANGELSNVSATLDRNTIEPSSVVPIFTEAAQNELSEDIRFLDDIGFFTDPISDEWLVQSEDPTSATTELPWTLYNDLADPMSDDWLVQGKDLTSATTELPWTPYNVSEEIYADGELSTMFDQTTIDSASIRSPIVTVAPHEVQYSNESDIFTESPFGYNIWNDFINPKKPEYMDFGGSSPIFMNGYFNFKQYSLDFDAGP